jgi:hypothetical protein
LTTDKEAEYIVDGIMLKLLHERFHRKWFIGNKGIKGN